jgi:hypothetical protein
VRLRPLLARHGISLVEEERHRAPRPPSNLRRNRGRRRWQPCRSSLCLMQIDSSRYSKWLHPRTSRW